MTDPTNQIFKIMFLILSENLSFISSPATILILCVCSLDHCGYCTLCTVFKAQDTQMHYLHMQMLCFHVQMTTNPRTKSINDSASKVILLLIRG